MAEIIDFTTRNKQIQNLIAAAPLEFRRGDWQGGFAMLCSRDESTSYEGHRREALRHPGHQHIGLLPEHINLAAGYHYTVLGLFRHRETETAMRRVYRLAGFMECVLNAPSPVLRTDLLRRFYQTITEEREALNVSWRGDIHHFLLPLEPSRYDVRRFFEGIATTPSLKELYGFIEAETNSQFDILCRHYVIYLPRSFGPAG
jgi:hypothetical protein